MDTFDYTNIINSAAKSLEKYGVAATIKKYKINMSTVPWEPSGRDLVETSCRGVIGEYKASDYTNTSIERGDIRFFLPSKGISGLETGDIISIATQDYKVILANLVAPGGVGILYDIQLRR